MRPFRCFAPVAAAAFTLAGLLGFSAPAQAQVPLINGFGGAAGYGLQCLSPNDDGSGPVINLTPAFPQGLKFFTTVHTSAFVNTNGNITFNARLSTYTPNPFPVAAQPMIAPYWGDVDIRPDDGNCGGYAGATTCTVCQPCLNPTENGVWWYLEPGRMVVTWDRTGYYNCHADLRMSFQLILTAAGCGGAGDFDVEFRYNRCEWESGDASGGVSGFGGTEAQAGFDAGNQADYVAIPGSMLPGIANLLCTTSNVGEPGIWRFQIRSGSVVCPDAGTPCDTGLLGACASGHTNCVGSGTECVQDVQPSTDKCDAIDNDCDGQVDEPDAALCADGLFCIAGTCVLPCSEFGCGAGQICDASGLCVDEACVDVVCDQGMRCENGVCVGACDGVVCPTGQVCRAGRCVDPCAGQDCDTCTVCEDGVCVSRCQYSPCASGETCQDDGRCIENACVGVPCDPGFHCEAGSCIDSCLGAVCPEGETCVTGECGGTQPEPPLDGGFGGGWPDDAFAPDPDGGAGLGGSEIGDADLAATDPYGCGCRTPGDGRARASGFFGLALAAMLASRRRGRRRHDR